MNENQTLFLNNDISSWLTATVIVIAGVIAIYRFRIWLQKYLERLATATETRLDDFFVEAFRHTHNLLLLPFVIYLASFALNVSPAIEVVIFRVAIATAFIQVAIWGNGFLVNWIRHVIQKKREEDVSATPMFVVIGFVLRVVLWSMVTLAILDNVGIDITAMLAGLGIGGIAIALAAQNVLSDLFSSLSIAFDKPFVIGDFIAIEDYLGTVEYIGLKTTRIRSLSGEQIIFSNSDLLGSRIRNYKRLQERRIVFSIGVTYNTPYDKLSRIPDIIREAINSQPESRVDRIHFKNYGDFSLNYEIVYFVLNPDYNVYMDIQHQINLMIYQRFDAEKIEFAFPTQTIYTHATSTAD